MTGGRALNPNYAGATLLRGAYYLDKNNKMLFLWMDVHTQVSVGRFD